MTSYSKSAELIKYSSLTPFSWDISNRQTIVIAAKRPFIFSVNTQSSILCIISFNTVHYYEKNIPPLVPHIQVYKLIT
jgi:hypothetical protein